MSLMHGLKWSLLVAVAAFAAGCAPLMAPPYSTDYAALDQLKRQSLDKVSVGQFQPRDKAAPVNSIGLRAASMVAPQGSFAQYLEEALVSDLKELALFDPQSGLRIDATLLKNVIDVSGMSTGSGDIQVEFRVSRGGKESLKKTYAASTSFESSFVGATAIPRGQNEYSRLVRVLLAKVYADADFVAAIKK